MYSVRQNVELLNSSIIRIPFLPGFQTRTPKFIMDEVSPSVQGEEEEVSPSGEVDIPALIDIPLLMSQSRQQREEKRVGTGR